MSKRSEAMTSIFQNSLQFELEHESWRWQGLTRRCTQIPVEMLARSRDGQTLKLWRVAFNNGALPLDADQPGGACWNTPEATLMGSGVGRVITGIADNKPFGDIEGFFLDAQNHGLDWSTLVFRAKVDGATRSHSLMSWAVEHQNVRAIKGLLGRGLGVTTPVNALDRALVAIGSSATSTPDSKLLNIARVLVEHSTVDDLNGPDAWCRQGRSLNAGVARYPLSILAASERHWGLLDTMIDRGAAPNVRIEGINGDGDSLVRVIERNLPDNDLEGWAVHRKALALSEQELLTAEASEQALTHESRVRARL